MIAVSDVKKYHENTKEFFGNVKEFFVQYLCDFRNRFKQLNVAGLYTQLVSVFLVCIAFALFCSRREGTGDLYMSVFIPIFFVNALIVLFAAVYKSSTLYSVLTVFFITTGAALQIFMLPPEAEGSLSTVYGYVAVMFASVVISFLAMPFMAMLTSEKFNTGFMQICVIALTVLMYLVILIFGKEVNGAKAWVYIGSTSVQVTEFTKVLAVIFFAMCFADKTLSQKRKDRMLFIMLLVHAGFLFAVNELGTLAVITLIYFVAKIIFAQNKKQIIYEIASLVLIVTVLLGICYGLYKMPDKETEASADTEVVQDEAEDEESAMDEIMSRLRQIYPKIEKRINIFLGTGDLTAEDTYQIDKANEALLFAEFIGVEKASLAGLPHYDSDFVFIYLIVRLGVLGMLLVFVALLAMLVEVFVNAARGNRYSEAIVAVPFVCIIAFQSVICACANIGLFPVVGLPFPFISSGGSALCVNLIMTFYLLYFMRKDNKVTSSESEAKADV